MVWKKMLVEEIMKDDLLMHGHLWCVNGMILAIQSINIA